jgi:hypothetical protein
MREIKIRATEKEIADLVKALRGLHAAEPEDTNEPQHENRRAQQSIAWTNANVDRVRQKVEITIKADAKEIAALVVAIQERRESSTDSGIHTGCINLKDMETFIGDVKFEPDLSDGRTLI